MQSTLLAFTDGAGAHQCARLEEDASLEWLRAQAARLLLPSPVAMNGESVSASSSTSRTAENVAVHEDITSVAAESTGDDPAAAGDGAGDGARDDEPAEPSTKRRKTHVPPEVKEWSCSLVRVKGDWTVAQSALRKKKKNSHPSSSTCTPTLLPSPQVDRAEDFPWSPTLFGTWLWQTSCRVSAGECALAQECWQNS